MTKAEMLQMTELRVKAALRWPTEACPVPVKVSTEYVTGERTLRVLWTYNKYAREVRQGCTDGYRHSYSKTDRCESREVGGPWFETEREAAIALRWAVSDEYARILHILDCGIDKPARKGG